MSIDGKHTCVERLAVDSATASAMLGMSRSHFLSLCSSGRIGPVARKLGRKSLFVVSELRDWCAAGMPPREQWVQMKKEAE